MPKNDLIFDADFEHPTRYPVPPIQLLPCLR